jgi:uncharacterized protein (DUF302 family)
LSAVSRSISIFVVGMPITALATNARANAARTPLMQAHQTIGIDLPLKVLAFEDAAGEVWLAYNAPAWLAARHGDAAQGNDVTKRMAAALEEAVNKAAGR